MNNKIERKILLNPGPSTTTDSVKMAQIVPDICPRVEEFGDLMGTIRNDLLKIVNADTEIFDSILISGSGTAAMESVISSVISKEKTLLILINGAYGDRMRKIAEIYSIPIETIEFDWSKPINFTEVDAYLKSNSSIGYIAMVHHETSTGMLNSIKSFSQLGIKYGYTLILDAISSYAGIPINLKKTPIDYLISTSNKCIQAMAGLAFVICNKNKLIQLKDIPNRSFYLSLFHQYDYIKKTGQMRFTPPVQTIYALKKAIDEFFEEGPLNRYKRYNKNWTILRSSLQKLGFNLYLNPEDESRLLLTVIEPNNKFFNYKKLHDLLYRKNFTIYPGKIGNQKTFRLAIFGAINKNDIKEFIINLQKVLVEMKVIDTNTGGIASNID